LVICGIGRKQSILGGTIQSDRKIYIKNINSAENYTLESNDQDVFDGTNSINEILHYSKYKQQHYIFADVNINSETGYFSLFLADNSSNTIEKIFPLTSSILLSDIEIEKNHVYINGTSEGQDNIYVFLKGELLFVTKSPVNNLTRFDKFFYYDPNANKDIYRLQFCHDFVGIFLELSKLVDVNESNNENQGSNLVIKPEITKLPKDIIQYSGFVEMDLNIIQKNVYFDQINHNLDTVPGAFKDLVGIYDRLKKLLIFL
jgi:hypothetical protein